MTEPSATAVVTTATEPPFATMPCTATSTTHRPWPFRRKSPKSSETCRLNSSPSTPPTNASRPFMSAPKSTTFFSPDCAGRMACGNDMQE